VVASPLAVPLLLKPILTRHFVRSSKPARKAKTASGEDAGGGELRPRRARITHDQLVGVRQHVKAAIAFLDWLTARDLTPAACRQNDLDAWIISGQASYRRETGHFIRWANKQKLTSLDFPATRWGGPSRGIDTETRWEQARRLLHDTSLDPEDRVAGLLVLLYAQRPSVISRLTLGHVHADDQQVQLSLGREPVTLPEPLASLVRQLLASRRGHAAIEVEMHDGSGPADEREQHLACCACRSWARSRSQPSSPCLTLATPSAYV
jgi:hypothetical protein